MFAVSSGLNKYSQRALCSGLREFCVNVCPDALGLHHSSAFCDSLPHFKRIQLARIIIFQHRFLTISVPLPERNPRLIRRSGFQQHRANAPQRHAFFALVYQLRSHSMPPVRLRDIQSHDVPQRRILFAQQKSHNLLPVDGHQAFRARQPQKIAQHRFGICNCRRETLLIQLIQRSEVLALVLPNSNCHTQIVEIARARVELFSDENP